MTGRQLIASKRKTPLSKPSALHTCVETVSDMHGLDIQVGIQQTALLYNIIYIDMQAVLYEKT